MSKHLFTAGYEGVDVNTFISRLQAKNVECVLDVRALAFSRKRGFSKKALAQELSKAGIRYVHIPELGTPKPIRNELKSTGDYKNFFRTMKTYLSVKGGAIESAYNHVNNSRCCLVCFERFADECHRKIVAGLLKTRDGNGLQVEHI